MAATPAFGITVKIDYTYDVGGFFGPGNPQGAAAGAQARSALEAAAALFTNMLDDSFSPIAVPATFHSSASDGMVAWQWTSTFNNPSTGNQVLLTHSTPGHSIAADEYVIFAGARNLTGAAIGGPGGFSWNNGASGSFSVNEINQINSITSTFQNQVERRGQASGFTRWGGSVAFDTIPPAPWHFGNTTLPPANTNDFFSFAVHELAHALGFGSSSEWDQLTTGLAFYGPNAQAVYGSPVPLADAGHWASSALSTPLGGGPSQQVLMTPISTPGSRRVFTELDAAGMRDIGWTVVPVPEPGSALLLISGITAVWRAGAKRAVG
jgi:hypothetical protein